MAPSQARIQSCPGLVVESRATATGTQCRRAVPASGAQPELRGRAGPCASAGSGTDLATARSPTCQCNLKQH